MRATQRAAVTAALAVIAGLAAMLRFDGLGVPSYWLDEILGQTLTDVMTPERLMGISVEEPTISVDFIVNNGPFAGRDGKFVTTRQVRDRLYKETEKNVALKVEDTV